MTRDRVPSLVGPRHVGRPSRVVCPPACAAPRPSPKGAPPPLTRQLRGGHDLPLQAARSHAARSSRYPTPIALHGAIEEVFPQGHRHKRQTKGNSTVGRRPVDTVYRMAHGRNIWSDGSTSMTPASARTSNMGWVSHVRPPNHHTIPRTFAKSVQHTVPCLAGACAFECRHARPELLHRSTVQSLQARAD